MFGYSPRSAANAYSKMDMETGVLAADPHKLILMLFDGAIMAILNGTQQLQAGKIPEKNKSIAHAIAIVEHGLRAALNKEVGGELALNLDPRERWKGRATGADGGILRPVVAGQSAVAEQSAYQAAR